jgi:DNA polymerase III gamma/tau subunit
VRDAVKYVDQVSILWDLNEENVSRFLGVAWEALIENLLNLIRQWDRNTIVSKLDDIEQHRIDLSQFAKQTLWYIDKHMLEDVDFYLKCFNSNEKVTNYDFENPYYI